ncbi:MAG: NAD(P)-dependent oxidoreductase [Rhodospirillaceae bacterium]|nr:NAD(P)-dependent oxidoreductase [Rhodospirillaceae bacterium]MBT6117952.1 NAD(P)-dependent oxidoreductase [Rhodospirillaceae bacterium]
MAKSYGFVGLGELGGKLATSLAKAGFAVWVHDLDRARAAAPIEAGAVWAESPGAAAEDADGFVSCLPSPAASDAVMTGKDGALAAMKPGSAWLEMSTSEAVEIRRLAALAAERGVETLECPVTGGVHRAAQGEITVFVGGEAAVLQAHRPALSAMCGPLFHLGPLGSASILKVITNMLTFVDLVAAGEVMSLAAKAGLDLKQCYSAICGSSGNSVEFETYIPRVLEGSYNSGFTMALTLKDIGFVTALGRELGVPLKLATLVEQHFVEAKARYGAGAWAPEVVRLMEDTTEIPLRAEIDPADEPAGRL